MDVKTGTAGAPSRIPQQQRSRASFERMLESAEQLLRERGSDDFTLNEVGKLGKVSIGSIYGRFDSKDELIRAVHERVIASVGERQVAAIGRAVEESGELPILVANLIDSVAEILREFAPILRPLMLRSVSDPRIAALGRESYAGAAALVETSILARRDEISHPDPHHAAGAVFRIAYAAIARFLGFGSPSGSQGDVMDWLALKEDLALMCSAFLKAPPELAKRKR